MSWHPPNIVGGPVLWWELVRGSRQRWPIVLRTAYLGLLVIEFLVLFPGLWEQSHWQLWSTIRSREGLIDTTFSNWEREFPTALVAEMRMGALRAASAEFLTLLLGQHLVLLFLTVPFATAGGLAREKAQDTLHVLLSTQLSATQIILGKLWGRVIPVLWISLVLYPVVLMLIVLAELPPNRAWFVLGQTTLFSVALASFTLLLAVWTRRSSDAVLLYFSVVVVASIICLTVLGDTPFLDWLNPFPALALLRIQDSTVEPHNFLPHLASWGCVWIGSTLLAVLALRRVSLGQRSSQPSRWRWLYRPRIGTNPIAWRECHFLGLAPLHILRGVPRWVGVLCVFGFSSILALSALDALAPGFLNGIRAGEFARSMAWLQSFSESNQVYYEVCVMGLVLLLLGTLVVGVRSGTSIAEEKARRTWDDIQLTAPLKDIVRSKTWGIVLATFPFLVGYALPMMALGFVGGRGGLLLASLWVLGSFAIWALVAAIAMRGSETELG